MHRPEDYVLNNGISQSDIKIFEESPLRFLNEVMSGVRPEQERKRHFDTGDLTDVFVLQPELIDNYGVIDATPTDAIIAICKKMYQRAKFESKGKVLPSIKSYAYNILPVCKEQQYYYNPLTGKWSRTEDTLKNTVITEGEKYFEQYVKIMEEDRIEVLKADYDKAEELENKLYDSKDENIHIVCDLLFRHHNEKLKGTDDYDPTIPPLPDYIKILTAYAQYATFRNKKVKHLGDLAIINEQEKTALPIDLKTADSHEQFRRNYWSCGYIRQGSLTSCILVANYPEYRILPFQFLVVPKSNELPEIYEMSKDELDAGLMGGTFASGKKYRGVAQILDDIDWHIENGEWDHKRSYYTNGNKNILNSFKDVNAELFIEDVYL